MAQPVAGQGIIMTSGSPNLNQRVNTLTGLVHGARLVWRLLQDPRVPGWIKLVPLFTLIYLISPIDLVPDVLVGPGQLDDLSILLLGLWVFLRLVPQDVLRQNAPDANPADNGAVDVTYRVVPKDPPGGAPSAQTPRLSPPSDRPAQDQ
jgi:uncharacterized membrane protein YkvA (DUF1232 family)